MAGDARVVVGVIRGALRDAGATGLALLGGGPGERRLLTDWLSSEAPEIPLWTPEETGLERVLGAVCAPTEKANPALAEEAVRFLARVESADGATLPANLVNRTALILSAAPPPERLLPLADLPASRVLASEGLCFLPGPFQWLEGDPDLLVLLEALLDTWAWGHSLGEIQRDMEEAARDTPGGRGELGTQLLSASPALAARAIERLPWDELEVRLSAGFLTRARDRIVPKLGSRTPWIDLDL